MCYQVVERYSICRCLYYKHAIDPCTSYGSRLHVVQEKTLLVGYSCSIHGQPDDGGQPAVIGAGDEVDAVVDWTDSSDDNGSIFSTALTLSRATSIVSGEGRDAVDEILHALVNDPLLRWEKLISQDVYDHRSSERMDVQFFLKLFEKDLRKGAQSALEYHACSFFRSRIRYLTAQICVKFNLADDTSSRSTDVPDSKTSHNIETRLSDQVDEDDPTAMPPSSIIRSFIVEGNAFQALKENVKNFSQRRRDYLEELTEIILKNIHPPDLTQLPHGLQRKCSGSWHSLVLRFLDELAEEASTCQISASDRSGIKRIRSEPLIITARIGSCWASKAPVWHFYPLVLVQSDRTQPAHPHTEEIKQSSEYDIFEDFICSSDAFLSFGRYIASLPSKYTWKSRLDKLAMPVRRNRKTLSSNKDLIANVQTLSLECCCGQTITDRYTELAPGALYQKKKQLTLMLVKQQFQHTATQRSRQESQKSLFQRFFTAFTINGGSKSDRLPRHEASSVTSQVPSGQACNTETSLNRHDHNFVHWCVPRTRYATHMFPLQSCRIYSDVEFFKSLRDHYDRSKPRLHTLFSFKMPVALRFVKFRLYQRQLVDINGIDEIPPESFKHEYEYTPMPAEVIPPIGPNLLMHFFTNPDEASSQPVLLSCIPKRKNDGLEPCPVRGSSAGWGIDVVTGINEAKVFGIGLFVSLTSITFGLVWAVVNKDIQGGFAVASFLLALFVFAVGSVKALDI